MAEKKLVDVRNWMQDPMKGAGTNIHSAIGILKAHEIDPSAFAGEVFKKHGSEFVVFVHKIRGSTVSYSVEFFENEAVGHLRLGAEEPPKVCDKCGQTLPEKKP